MNTLGWLAISFGAILLLYAAILLGLVAAGRREHVRAVAGFVPDCLVLVRRLLSDPRVPSGRKWMLVGLIGYLMLPIDLVPDFLPVVGQLDDIIIAVLVLRSVLVGTGPTVLQELWPGPESSGNMLAGAAFRFDSPSES